MPLEFTCPACGKALSAPFAAAGLEGNCKFCKARIIAPAMSGQPATPAGSPPPPGPPPPGPQPGAPPPGSTYPGSDYAGAAPPPPPYGGPEMPPPHGEPAGASSPYSPPGYVGQDYSPIGTMPPPDIMSNPVVAKAFMSSGTPAVSDFWKRFLGFGLDMVLITASQIGLTFLMLGSMKLDTTDIWSASKADVAGAFWFTFALFAARVLYGAIFEGSPMQATPGKWVLGMKVCTENGQPLSFAGAVWRNFAKWATISLVSFVPFVGWFPYFIFFYAMQNELTQTLHDMVAGTVVAERNY